MAARIIKRYELLSEIGRGGIAVVYRAQDTSLHREVAVKVLHPHLASRAESSERFRREARAVAKLRHPNIVEIYDFSGDEDDSEKFIVTEYIRGTTLREFVDTHGVAFPEVGVAITLQVAEALAHAHGLGIIHRDIKPENVMLREDGCVKLMDFGIAHVLDADRMTASGSLLGSPAHMPPEIVDGKPSDFRSDIFSLGTVLYFATTNALPFEGNSPTAVLRNIIDARYVDPTVRNGKISRRLGFVVRQCMHTDPDARYSSIQEVRDALSAELEASGIEDAAALCTSYIEDPQGFAETFTPVLVERLLKSARAAVEQHKVADASDLLNRILAYDPSNREADELLERLQSGRRARTLAVVLAACLLLGGLAWAAWSAFQVPSGSVDHSTTSTPPVAEVAPALDVTSVRLLGERAGARATLGPRLSDFGRTPFGVGLRRLTGVRSWATSASLGTVTGLALGAFPAGKPPTLVATNMTVVHKPQGRDPRPVRDTSSDARDVDVVAPPVLENPRTIYPSKAVIPVWPPDAYAIVDGRKYEANVNGEIEIELMAGSSHEVVLRCPQNKCEEDHVIVQVGATTDPARQAVFKERARVMQWAAGFFLVNASGKRASYWWAYKGEGSIKGFLPGSRIAISDFDNYGHAKQIWVFEVPDGVNLGSLTVAEANRKGNAKLISVGPGQVEQVNF